jgi:hypothetical protein
MPPRRRSKLSTPLYRATINHGTIVTLNAWEPWLVDEGPSQSLLDDAVERGIVLADLPIVAGELGRDLIVRFVPGETATQEAAEAVLDWAATVGHLRVWLPDRVVELRDTLVPGDPVSTTCRSCFTTWTDSSPDFWALVRKHGRFPGLCLVCGHTLAEWQVPDYLELDLGPEEDA